MPKGTGVYLGPGALHPVSHHDPGARDACERPTEQRSTAGTASAAAVHSRSTPLADSDGLAVAPRAHSWSSGRPAAAPEAATAAAAASGSSHTPIGWGGVPLMVQPPSQHRPASQHAPGQARPHRPAGSHAGSSGSSSSSSSHQHLAAGRSTTAAAGRGHSMAASRLAAAHPLYRGEAAEAAASVASSSASSSASSLPRLPPDSVIARSAASSWCSGPRSSDACGGYLPSTLIQLQDWDEQPAPQATQQQHQQLAQMPPMRQSSLTDSGSELLVLSELQPAVSPEPAVQHQHQQPQQQQQLPGLARWSLQSASSDQPWQAAGGPAGGLHQPEPGAAPTRHVLVRQSTNELYSCPLPASLPFGGEDVSSAAFDDSSFLASVGVLLGGGGLGDDEPTGLFPSGTGGSSGPLPAVVDVSCSATSLTPAAQGGWAGAAPVPPLQEQQQLFSCGPQAAASRIPAAGEPHISTIVAGLQETFIQANSSALDTSRYAVLHPGSTWSTALPGADQSAAAGLQLPLHSLSTPLMPVASVQQQQQQQQQLLLQPHSPQQQQQQSWGQLQQPETRQANLQQLIDGRIEELLMRRNELLGGASAAAIAAAVGSAGGVGAGGAFLQRSSPQQNMVGEGPPSLALEALLQQQQHGPGLRRVSPAAAAAFELAGSRTTVPGPPTSPSQQQLQQDQLLLQALQQGVLQLPGGADALAPGAPFR